MADVKKVLIVDDEADAVAIAEAMLSDIGGVVTVSANDSDAGLAKARAEKLDLIILDVQMPGKNGFDLFADLKRDEATKDIPVIMLTGVESKTGIGFSAKDMQAFLGAKPDAYLDKPVEPETLQTTVKQLLGL